MTKKIMFVGAGKFQLPGIRKAREMGLFVIATDGDSGAPGLKLADISYVLDVKDLKANLDVARKNSIDGILAVASDVSLKTVGAISQELRLPGLSLDVIERCTDKELMRNAFFKNRVPSPKSYAVYSYEELLEKAGRIGYPLVVKPADNAGSRGVRMVFTKQNLNEAYLTALKNSRKGKVLIEEFMEGFEVSVEAFIYEGRMNVIALSDKVRTSPPYLLDIKVIFPSAYPYNIRKEIIKVAENVIEAVGINIGPVHMELMMTKDGPVPVEVAARGPGFKVFTDILPMITGIDLLKVLIQISLNEKPSLKKTKNMSSVIKFINVKSGILKKISGLDKAIKVEDIYDLELYVKEGDKVNELTCGSDRIGHIISIAGTREKAEKAINKAESLLKIEVEESIN